MGGPPVAAYGYDAARRKRLNNPPLIPREAGKPAWGPASASALAYERVKHLLPRTAAGGRICAPSPVTAGLDPRCSEAIESGAKRRLLRRVVAVEPAMTQNRWLLLTPAPAATPRRRGRAG